MSNPVDSKVLKFRLTKVRSALAQSPCYRASVVSDRTIGIDETCADIVAAGNAALSAVTLAYAVRIFVQHVPGLLAADGNRRQLGELVTFAPRITGSFPSADAAFDPARNTVAIEAYTPATLKAALAGVNTRNVTNGVAASIAQVVDAATKTPGVIIGKGKFIVSGANIGFDATHSDEWIKLQKDDGTEAGTIVVEENMPNMISGALALTPDAIGKYKLVLSTRGGLDLSYGTMLVRKEVEFRLP